MIRKSVRSPIARHIVPSEGRQPPGNTSFWMAVWLDEKPLSPSWSLLAIEGDPLIVSCLKTAESGNDMIVRAIEMQGKAAQATLRINLPQGRKIARVYRCNCLEVERAEMPVENGTVKLKLKPNEIMTIGIAVK